MMLKILVFGVTAYLLWAVAHHKKDKSLTGTVFLEYVLLAALSLILLFGVIFDL